MRSISLPSLKLKRKLKQVYFIYCGEKMLANLNTIIPIFFFLKTMSQEITKKVLKKRKEVKPNPMFQGNFIEILCYYQITYAPGVIFTTLRFLRNIRMGTIS
jgi:hypothetical protein